MSAVGIIHHRIGKSNGERTVNAANLKHDPSVFPSVDALAEYLGLGRVSTYAGLRDGTIPSIRVGKRYILPRTAIQEWLRTAGGDLRTMA
jgi:excisionase family DNA binding protein